MTYGTPSVKAQTTERGALPTQTKQPGIYAVAAAFAEQMNVAPTLLLPPQSGEPVLSTRQSTRLERYNRTQLSEGLANVADADLPEALIPGILAHIGDGWQFAAGKYSASSKFFQRRVVQGGSVYVPPLPQYDPAGDGPLDAEDQERIWANDERVTLEVVGHVPLKAWHLRYLIAVEGFYQEDLPALRAIQRDWAELPHQNVKPLRAPTSQEAELALSEADLQLPEVAAVLGLMTKIGCNSVKALAKDPATPPAAKCASILRRACLLVGMGTDMKEGGADLYIDLMRAMIALGVADIDSIPEGRAKDKLTEKQTEFVQAYFSLDRSKRSIQRGKSGGVIHTNWKNIFTRLGMGEIKGRNKRHEAVLYLIRDGVLPLLRPEDFILTG